MAMAQEAYLESTVLCADRIELVRMLYQAALDSVEKARRHLRQGEIAARCRQISRAVAILAELGLSIDQDAEPLLGRNLAELYDYMERRLIEANGQQREAPLAEVSRLLATLLDAWVRCKPPETPTARPPVVAAEHSAQSWSL